MIRMIPFLFYVFFAFQVTAWSMTDSLRYHMQHFTDEQGLPQNSINGIGVDEYGFVWLATEGGITRYDGRNFKVFDAGNLGLHSNRFPLIRYVHDTKKLYGMNGLYEKILLSKGRAWHYDHTPEYMIKTPVNVIETPFQNATGLPGYYDSHGSTLYQMDGINGGNFIISHDTIFYYDRNHRIQSRVEFPSEEFYQFFLLDQRLFHLDFKGEIKNIEPSGVVNDIEISGDIIQDGMDLKDVKIYWNIGTSEVFFYVDGSFYRILIGKEKRLKTELLLKGFDFEQNDIFSAHYDPYRQRIFLGSKTDGLFILTRKQFRTLSAGEKLEEHLYYGQLSYEEDQVMVSQGYVFSDTGLVEVLPDMYAATEKRRSLFRDQNGYIWTTAYWKWIYKFSPDGRHILHEKYAPEAVSCMYEGLNGQIWLGTYGGGVYTYDEEKESFHPYLDIKDEIICLQQTTTDTLLAGTSQSGVIQLHIPSGKIDSIPGLTGKTIRSLYYDSDKNLWITTYSHGFFLYRNHKLTKLPLDQQNYLQSSHCILEDNQGFFWISTNTGLFQVRKKDLLRHATDSTALPYYILHNKEEGFNTNEFNGGCQPCAVKTGNGYFSFPSMDGLVWFRPGEIVPEVPDRNIIIDDFNINGIEQRLRDTFTVEQGFDQIKIEIATAYFGNPENLHLEYQISPENKNKSQWFPVENESIFLNDLRSGLHQVAVRQANVNGPEGNHLKSVFIVVPPLFYETWTFMGLCFIAALFLIWAIINWRSNRIRTQNIWLQQKVDSQTQALQEYVSELEKSESKLIRQSSLLENLSTAISHDIKSPLSFIVHAMNKVSEELSKERHQLAVDSQATYSYILQVYEYVNKMTNHTSSLLTHRKQQVENINLHNLVQARFEIFKPLANKKGNELVNTIDPQCEWHTNGELLTIVVHNLIDNANKHSTTGTITVSALRLKEGLHLHIVDTGEGMDPKQVLAINSLTPVNISENGLGLHIVKYLTTIIDCQFTINSQPGKGTTATLFFRVDHTIKSS